MNRKNAQIYSKASLNIDSMRRRIDLLTLASVEAPYHNNLDK